MCFSVFSICPANAGFALYSAKFLVLMCWESLLSTIILFTHKNTEAGYKLTVVLIYTDTDYIYMIFYYFILCSAKAQKFQALSAFANRFLSEILGVVNFGTATTAFFNLVD